MSFFPFMESDESLESVQDIPTAREWAWNFETNDFMLKNRKPYVVEGLEAVKIWAYKALKTDRFKHSIYSWEYGSEINSLIGSGYTKAAIESEVKRMIDEALMNIPQIEGVDNLEVVSEEDFLTISFVLKTIYGSAEVNIDGN